MKSLRDHLYIQSYQKKFNYGISISNIVFTILIGLIFIIFLYYNNIRLKKEISKVNKEQEEIVSIDPGDRAILPDYGLKQIDTNQSFKVTYEVEILEVSIDKVKVKAINYTSNDIFAKDPANKPSIINFLKDKWVNRKDIELIIDDSIRRDP